MIISFPIYYIYYNKRKIMKTLLIVLVLFTANVSYSQYSIDKHRNTDITKEEIYDHINYLASKELGGRLNGTEGDILAQSYLSSELKKYGCAPKGDSLFTQFIRMRTNGTRNYNALKADITYNKFKYCLKSNDGIIMNLSSNGTAKGEIVIAGYNHKLHKDSKGSLLDFGGNEVDVIGKVLVVFADIPEPQRYNAEYASQSSQMLNIFNKYLPMNPSGIIIVKASDTSHNNNLFISDLPSKFYYSIGLPVMSMKRDVIKRVMRENGYDIDSVQNKIMNSEKSTCFELKNVIAQFKDDVKRVYLKTGNIVGFIEGNDPVLKNEVIVIGAHFDHVGPQGRSTGICLGADDNASGTAGILEIAQKLCVNRDSLKRSVLVIFFGAEEGGLNGSEYFELMNEYKRYNIVAMMNLDMIGRLRENIVLVYVGEKKEIFKSRLQNFNSTYNLDISLHSESIGRSDQKSFDNRGIPTITFFTNIHEDYHTSGDVASKIYLEGANRITNLGYDIIYDMCVSEKLNDK